MHGIIICRCVGNQRIAFIATTYKKDQKTSGKMQQILPLIGEFITNDNANLLCFIAISRLAVFADRYQMILSIHWFIFDFFH